MSQFLPLFPLSLVVFPGEELRLHIFEPRYRQLIQECLDGETTFGIPAVIDDEMVKFATEMQVVSVDKQYAEGRMDITTRGLRRARIGEFFHQASGKLYPGGEIDWVVDRPETNAALQKQVFTLLDSLHEVLGITKRFAEDASGIRSFLIGHHVGFSLSQEYELLMLEGEEERLQFIADHLEAILPVVTETERLKAKAKLNGHYKNMIPPDF